MKKLAFRTTTVGDETVESSENPNPINSLVKINSTFADRDAKTINETQLQENMKLPETISSQNMELCTYVFDQAVITNRDSTEEEVKLGQLAMSNQDYKYTLPLIYSQIFAVVPGLTCLVDWEHARMNKDEQWEFLD